MKKDVENTTILDEKDQEIEELRLSNSRLKDRVKWLERALFSSRSERIVSSNGDQLEFDDLLAELAELNQELESQEKPASPVENKLSKKRKKRRSLDELIPEDLPRQDITLDVPEVERTCPDTGEAFKKIGEEISEKVAYKPGSYFVKRYIRPKYVHPSASSYGVLCEPMFASAIAGSSFDECFTAGVAVDKCAYNLPLYRQQEKMKNAGLDISRQTLSQHYIRGAEALKPLFTLMKERSINSRYIFTDDTPVQLQMKGKGKTATGRMWVYIAGGESPPYQVFDFTIDRKKEHY